MADPNRTSNVATNIFTVVLWIYLLPAMFIFTPYYNWQYARENGFVNWLLLGEVVATAKAFGWPYFVFLKKSPPPINTWTENDKQNAKHLMAAFQANLEAVRISNAGGPGLMSRDDVTKILMLEKTALREASLVEDRVLDKVHPQLKQHFRNELQPKIQLKIQLLEGGPASLNIQIDALEDKWVTWFNSNKDEIYIPK